VVRAAKRLAEVEKFDAVLASIPLNSNGVAGAIIARRLGVPLVLDVRDDWVDGAYFLEKGAMARAAERRLERFVFESAKAIVLVSKLSLQRHQSQHPSLSERFTFIPNGFDLSDLGDRSREERREVSGRLLLVHAGMTGSLRSPVPLFRAIRAILDTASAIDKPRFALVMVGELLPEYRRAIVDLGLEGVVDVRQYLPTSDYLRLMSEADVLVAIADAAYVTEIPGKLYTHWAVGRPTLLLADPGAGTELMSEHKLGWSCSPSDHEGIKELLLGLWRQKRAEGIGSVQPGGIDRFDRRNLTAELSFLLNSVAPSHN
jgi:glycosyltransferase involved in cell wall biosynthesis